MTTTQYETVMEVCRRLQISRATLYRLMEEGLPSLLFRSSRRFDPAEVDRWIAERGEKDHD